MNPLPGPFSNHPVSPENLPDFSTVPLEPVAPRFRSYLLIHGFLLTLALVLGAGLFGGLVWGRMAGWLLSGAGLLIMLLVLLHAWLDPRYRGWAVREHDLIARHGVIWRRTVILPLVRVQHVETASGPLERLFDLMRLQCFSAGGASADVVFHGLSTEKALRIRAHLLERISEDGIAQGRGQLTEP